MNENEFSIKQQNNVNGNNIDTQINYYQSNKEICHRIVNSNSDISVSKNFTGRKEEMNRICKLLDNNKNVLISGMGGIGKTEICKNLYHKYNEENFDYLVYLNYENTIDNTIMNSLLRTQISDNYNNDLQSTWNNLSRISNNKKAIIFIDNMNKTIKEDPNLKKLNSLSCSILITSRNKVFQNFEVVDIDFMEERICKDLFLKTCVELNKDYKIFSEEEQLLDYIIKEIIFRHTQTIILLSHIMIDNCWNINELKENLLKENFNLEYLKDGTEDTVLIEEYKKLFTLSNLENNQEFDIINILEAFAIFPYIPLPLDICNRWLLEDAKISVEKNNKKSNSKLLIKKIYRKGWLQCNQEKDCFYMHPIISKTILSMRSLNSKNHENLISKCLEDINKNRKFLFKNFFPYNVFAENIYKYLDDGNSLDIVYLFFILSDVIINNRNPIEIETFLNKYKSLLSKSESKLEENELEIAIIYNNMSTLYKLLGKYKEALSCSNLGTVILENLLKKKMYYNISLINLVLAYNNRAVINLDLENYDEALDNCNKSLDVLEEEYLQKGSTYNIMGLIYRNLDKNEEALSFYKKALDLKKFYLGSNHFEVAIIYGNMATAYSNMKKNEEAIKLIDKEIEIYTNIFNNCNYYLGAAYNRIAYIYHNLNQFETALNYYKEAFKILEKELGENHPEIAIIYKNISEIYINLNNNNKALVYLGKAFRIFKDKCGLNHTKTKMVEQEIKNLEKDNNCNF